LSSSSKDRYVAIMNSTPTPDALPDSWLFRLAPAAAHPYLRLARLDRPIGTWLLLWPCWWSVALAGPASGHSWPSLRLMLLFALGAIVMRGAGCTYNDIVDKDIDAQVERTKNRPLASGQVTIVQAWRFAIGLALTGLAVLLMLGPPAIGLGIASLLLVAIYPFMKRITFWPQLFLGLAFNWGALMGYAAATEHLASPAVLLYLTGIAWTLGYDTIYAHQDKDDDALIGVKSTALKFGAGTAQWLFWFYGAMLVLLWLAAGGAGLGWGFKPLLILVAAHLMWQITRLDTEDPASCLRLFRANRETGGLVFLALLAGSLTQ
jgi:4-hydroxybenzoate polyprenyltransferase